jgi:hypothetical protein
MHTLFLFLVRAVDIMGFTSTPWPGLSVPGITTARLWLVAFMLRRSGAFSRLPYILHHTLFGAMFENPLQRPRRTRRDEPSRLLWITWIREPDDVVSPQLLHG